MNEKQKQLVIKWTFGYIIIIIMFAAMYYLNDPMPIFLAIMMIVALFGGKKYKYDKERTKREMQEFIEYSTQHKYILTATVTCMLILPALLYWLWKKDYIQIDNMTKTPLVWANLTLLPFLFFDLSHKVHIYRTNANLTEQGNQGDGD